MGVLRMGRKAAILNLRRPRPRKIVRPGPVRTDKLRFSRRRKSLSVWPALLLGAALIPALFVAGPVLIAPDDAPLTSAPVSR